LKKDNYNHNCTKSKISEETLESSFKFENIYNEDLITDSSKSILDNQSNANTYKFSEDKESDEEKE